MNGLIQELTTELKSNSKLKDSAVVRVVLEAITNSILLGVPSEEILNNALTNLDELATATVNENLKEVVSKFKSMAIKPTKRLQDMAKEAGITMKIKILKESKIASDPTFAYGLSKIMETLAIVPEFRAIGIVFEALNKFAYDPMVSKVLTDINTYVNENRAKLEVMNAIFEMRQTSSITYKDAIIVLEEALLEDNFGADSIRMKMRGRVEMPIINRLVNTISMVEAKSEGKFNIGIGNGDAKVNSVIAPFYKVSESEAIVLIDNSFIKLSDDKDPSAITLEEAQSHPEFYALCEAYATLNFRDRNGEAVCNGRKLEVAFAVNEAGNLQLKLNGHVVDDLAKINLTDLFMMEQLDVRANLVKVFNTLDMIVNLEFGKKIVNERLDKDSIIFTIGENIYVFEKIGQTRMIKKMQGLAFHNYVMENFHYDVSELYTIELGEREDNMKRIDEEKSKLETDLAKLEKSIIQLEEALQDTTMDEQYHVQLSDLKSSIEKNVVALKNHYIELDQSKKKV